MKFKVGDRVKVIKNYEGFDFEKGDIVQIIKTDESSIPNKCKRIRDGLEQWVGNDDIELIKYTWEDFKNAPIGTKVTFESEDVLVKTQTNMFEGKYLSLDYDEFKDFQVDDLGKIIKIEEPTYTTVYEPKEVVMPEIEEMKRLTDELCKTCDEFIKKIKEK